MQIYNKKTKEIIAIIDNGEIVLNKSYDVSFNEHVITNGQKVYADTSESKIINIKDYKADFIVKE